MIKYVSELEPGDVFESGTVVLDVQECKDRNWFALTLDMPKERGLVQVERFGLDKISLQSN